MPLDVPIAEKVFVGLAVVLIIAVIVATTWTQLIGQPLPSPCAPCASDSQCSENKTCVNGCCRSVSCLDTDGGRVPPVPGSVTLITEGKQSKSFSDACTAKRLLEYWCDGTSLQSERISCQGSCVNNSCVELGPTISVCGDGVFDPAMEYCGEPGAPLCTNGQVCNQCNCVDTCQTSTSEWIHAPFNSQSGDFTIEFDATPNQNLMDGVITLSNGPADAFSESAVLIRFNPQGFIDVRNGSIYDYDTVLNYSAGVPYHFVVDVSVIRHVYSVHAGPVGSTPQLLAMEYAFRDEQNTVSRLDHANAWSVDGTNFGFCNTFLSLESPSGSVCGDGVCDEGETCFEDYTDCDIIACYLTPTCFNGCHYTPTPNGVPEDHGLCNDVDHACDGAGNCIEISPDSQLTPIARWDTVQRQRIEANSPLNVGVVAFSKFGIQKVVFTPSGKAPIMVTEMTQNPQTNVWEYWTPISAEWYTTNGPITVAATVYGNDGGTRTLTPLTLIVYPIPVTRPTAWVAASGGNDTTGTVNDSSKPFATIGKALDKIRAWNAANGFASRADGGIVRLRPGEHTMQNAGLWAGVTTIQEWVTITNDPQSGGTKENTKINQVTSDGQFISSEWLKIQSITLQIPTNNRPLFETGSNDNKSIWLDDTIVIGSDRYHTNPHPVGQNYRHKYFTNSDISNVRFAQGEGYSAEFAQNLTIHHIGEDAFADSPHIVNVTLWDQDPGPPGGYQWHADAWQSPGITTSAPAPTNYIVYNYKGTDLHYQGIFGRVKQLSSNNAFVNVFLEMRSPVRDYGSGNEGVGSWLGGTYDHLLIWNSTFIGTGFSHDFWFANESYTGSPQFRMTNSSFRGNVFNRWLTTEGLTWTQDSTNVFQDNHYITFTGPLVYTPGPVNSFTKGDAGLIMDTSSQIFGFPSETSVLNDRMMSPPVPADLLGNFRGSPADIGAFESNLE